MDGPSHLYNAWLFKELLLGPSQGIATVFRLNLLPFPNWTGHALLSLLMTRLAPELAERLFLSAYVLFLLASIWYLAKSGERADGAAAFLYAPFAYNQLLAAGFYSFCLGTALFAFALGFGSRRLRQPSRRSGPIGLHLLLTSLYFTHLVPHLLALAALALLWCLRWRHLDRVHRLWPLTIFLPQLVLPIWFAWRSRWRTAGWGDGDAETVWSFFRFDALEWWPHGSHPGPLLLSILFWTIASWTLARFVLRIRRYGTEALTGSDLGFLLLGLILIALLVVAPDSGFGGSIVRSRLRLFPLLALLPWLALAKRPWLRASTLTAAVAISLSLLAQVDAGFHKRDRELAPALDLLEQIPPGRSLLAIPRAARSSMRHSPVFDHAAELAAVRNGLIHWNHFEAQLDYFPVSYQRSLQTPDGYLLATRTLAFDLTPWRDQVDFVWIVGQVPPNSVLGSSLETGYRRVADRDEQVLYISDERSGGGPGADLRPRPR